MKVPYLLGETGPSARVYFVDVDPNGVQCVDRFGEQEVNEPEDIGTHAELFPDTIYFMAGPGWE